MVLVVDQCFRYYVRRGGRLSLLHTVLEYFSWKQMTKILVPESCY